MYLFDAGENAPKSSLLAGGFYTDNESWAGMLGTQTYLTDDKYRIKGWLGYLDFNVDFFGIGHDAGERGEPLSLERIGSFFVPSFLIRIADNLYVGPRYRFLDIETTADTQGLPPGHPLENFPARLKIKSSGLGIILNYDDKDGEFYPHHGSFLEVNTNFALKDLGSDLDYKQLQVGYSLFTEIGEQQVLAWRITGCQTGGNTPFFDLCLLGGMFDSIRGYVSGQYRDDLSLTTQLEYRWRFYKKLGMVAFGGIGQVADNLSGLNAENILPSIGAGIRFRVSEAQGVNVGIDYAKGKDSDAWYFRIGEAF
jgi:outer membrane protein assembly factor BamA